MAEESNKMKIVRICYHVMAEFDEAPAWEDLPDNDKQVYEQIVDMTLIAVVGGLGTPKVDTPIDQIIIDIQYAILKAVYDTVMKPLSEVHQK